MMPTLIAMDGDTPSLPGFRFVGSVRDRGILKASHE